MASVKAFTQVLWSPIFDTAALCGGFCGRTDINQLQKLQNRAARIVVVVVVVVVTLFYIDFFLQKYCFSSQLYTYVQAN